MAICLQHKDRKMVGQPSREILLTTCSSSHHARCVSSGLVRYFFKDIAGTNYLDVIRRHKCQLWWEFVKTASFQERRHDGAVHNRQGQTVTFETVLVELIGTDWRTRRDSFKDFQDWKRHCDELVNNLCESWKVLRLPSKRMARTQADTDDADRGLWKVEALSMVETCREQPHPRDNRWEAGKRCFLFVSDSQVVVNILTGRAPLLDDSLRPVFTE